MTSTRWRLIAAALVTLLLLSGAVCCGSGTPDTPDTTAPAGPPPGLQAKDYLPNANISWSAQLNTGHYEFGVDAANLASLADPLGRGLELVDEAMGNTKAPRRFGSILDTAANKVLFPVQLATSAVKCLHQHNHLELYVYVDKQHLYSLALVLIINVDAYRDLNVSLCVVQDLLPLPCVVRCPLPQLSPAPPSPTLDPCVGVSKQDSFVRLWLGTTDAMCGALGPSVPPPSSRSVHSGDQGPEVTFLQYHLNQVGFTLAVDGIFGAQTELALNQFQRCYQRDATPGVADDATRQALLKAEENKVKCA